MEYITVRGPSQVEDMSPSLICTDLTSLADSARNLQNAGCRMLHVDILDGYFSPSMPIGVDMVKQLRKKCDMDFDVHIMAVENDFFIKEMIGAGAQRICFHVETERHITKKLTEIKKAGIQAGIALMPATSPEQFEYALELCDFVVLMRINPGYASSRDEKEYSFVTKKLCRLSDMIARENYGTTITVDGRTYFERICELTAAGMDTVVGGTSNIFSREGTTRQNVDKLRVLMKKGREARRNQ